MAHWLFCIQYIRTSLVFPKLLTKERLHKLERDSQPTQVLDIWKPMQTEDGLAALGVAGNRKRTTLVETFKHCDTVFVQLSAEIKVIDK